MHFHLDIYVRVDQRIVHNISGFHRVTGIMRYDEEVIRSMMNNIAQEVEATQVVRCGESNIYYCEDGDSVAWWNGSEQMLLMAVSSCNDDCEERMRG